MNQTDDLNGSERQVTVKEHKTIVIDSDVCHRVKFAKDTVINSTIYGDNEPEFPLEGEASNFAGFKLTGIYSGKDIKVVKCEGSGEFPKHSHKGREVMTVLKGKITVYCYDILAMGLLLSILLLRS